MSLDAVLVAVLWQVFSARVFSIELGWREPLLLAFSVWVIYTLDHVFDAAQPLPPFPEPARKAFVRQHRIGMLSAACALTLLAALLAAFSLPALVFHAGIALVLVVALYFGAVHTVSARRRPRSWPRELAVALLFTAGVLVPLWTRTTLPTPAFVGAGLLLLLLVWANCSAVETWDWARAGQPASVAPGNTARFIAFHLAWLPLPVVLVAVVLQVPPAFSWAAVLSAIALAVAGPRIPKRTRDASSALADLTLCWPLPILLLLWLRP